MKHKILSIIQLRKILLCNENPSGCSLLASAFSKDEVHFTQLVSFYASKKQFYDIVNFLSRKAFSSDSINIDHSKFLKTHFFCVFLPNTYTVGKISSNVLCVRWLSACTCLLNTYTTCTRFCCIMMDLCVFRQNMDCFRPCTCCVCVWQTRTRS